MTEIRQQLMLVETPKPTNTVIAPDTHNIVIDITPVSTITLSGTVSNEITQISTPTLQPTYTLQPKMITPTLTAPQNNIVGFINESTMILIIFSLQLLTLLLVFLLVRNNKSFNKRSEINHPQPEPPYKTPDAVVISNKVEETQDDKSSDATSDNKSPNSIVTSKVEDLLNKSSDITMPENGIEGDSKMPIKSGFVSVATRSKTLSENDNQDSGKIHQTGFVRIIAVADGVGSAKNSKIASQQLVDLFIDIASHISEKFPITVSPEVRTTVFYNKAVEQISKALSQKELPLNSASTTFIGIIENVNHYIVTYLADGSIFRVKQSSDGEKFVVDSMLMNLSSPDVPQQISAKGKTISPEIHKIIQNEGGDMWIIASDGMNDFNPSRDVKTKSEDFIRRFANEIWQAYKENPDKFESVLHSVLLRWVKLCQTTDDATVAVLISGEMKSQWDKLINHK